MKVQEVMTPDAKPIWITESLFKRSVSIRPNGRGSKGNVARAP